MRSQDYNYPHMKGPIYLISRRFHSAHEHMMASKVVKVNLYMQVLNEYQLNARLPWLRKRLSYPALEYFKLDLTPVAGTKVTRVLQLS